MCARNGETGGPHGRLPQPYRSRLKCGKPASGGHGQPLPSLVGVVARRNCFIQVGDPRRSGAICPSASVGQGEGLRAEQPFDGRIDLLGVEAVRPRAEGLQQFPPAIVEFVMGQATLNVELLHRLVASAVPAEVVR